MNSQTSTVHVSTPSAMYRPRRILKLQVVEARTGLKGSAIYGLIPHGEFPAPKQLTPSGRAVGWDEQDIDAWIASRPVATPSSVIPWRPPQALGITAPPTVGKPKTLSKNGKRIGRPPKPKQAFQEVLIPA